jgi:hypothetical protein
MHALAWLSSSACPPGKGPETPGDADGFRDDPHRRWASNAQPAGRHGAPQRSRWIPGTRRSPAALDRSPATLAVCAGTSTQTKRLYCIDMHLSNPLDRLVQIGYNGRQLGLGALQARSALPTRLQRQRTGGVDGRALVNGQVSPGREGGHRLQAPRRSHPSKVAWELVGRELLGR